LNQSEGEQYHGTIMKVIDISSLKNMPSKDFEGICNCGLAEFYQEMIGL